MNRVLGLLFLIIGAALLYYGWQAQEAAPVAPDLSTAVTGASATRPIWLLALGAVTAVWGLYALLRRNVH